MARVLTPPGTSLRRVSRGESGGARTAPLFIGVDVGGTKVAAAVVDPGGAREWVERPTALESGERLLGGIEAAVREVVDSAGRPAAIGVGVPSQIEFATGRVLASVNIPLEGVPLRDELGRRLGTPVHVDNDGNCAALAEANAAGTRQLVMLTLGTGVGGGLVIDGAIYRGATGLGGELGHVVIDLDGPECPGNCPNRGCIEALCSGLALERDAGEIARARPRSALGGIASEHGRVTGRDAVRLARAGDTDALALLEGFGHRLGVAIAVVMNAFEPERVVIGGGLSDAADLFFETARREAAARALPTIVARCYVSLARTGAAAGVIGAGLLAAQEHAASEGVALEVT